MKLTIEMDLGNAAFEEEIDGKFVINGDEVGMILNQVASKFIENRQFSEDDGEFTRNINDRNGNWIGELVIKQ